MTSKPDFKLYTTQMSPFSVRIMVLIALKKLNVETIDPNKIGMDDYLKIIPAGRVPAIELPDGRTVIESEAICEFIEETFTDIPAYPSDPFDRARLRLIARRADIDLASSLSPITILQQTGKRDKVVLDHIRSSGKKALNSLETLLAERQPYAMGEKLSHADGVLLTVLHMVERMWQIFEIGDPYEELPVIRAYREALGCNPVIAEIEGPYLVAVDKALAAMQAQ